MKNLDDAVKDGIITPKEMKGLEQNVTYGIGERGKNFDAPMLVYFPSLEPKPDIESIVAPKKIIYDEAKQPLPLPKIPKDHGKSPRLTTEDGPALIFGAETGIPFQYGATIGGKWNNLALTLTLDRIPDENIININKSLGGNISYIASEDYTNITSITGAVTGYIPITKSLSLSVGPSFGAKMYTRKDTAAIADVTDPSNPVYINQGNGPITSSYLQEQWVLGGNVGMNLRVGPFGINPYVGYRRVYGEGLTDLLNGSDEFVGGANLIFYLGKRKSEK